MHANYLAIHPKNPQPRLIQKVAQAIENGKVVVLPSESSYTICCALQQKQAVERIQTIRQVDKHHHFTLMCKDLSQVSVYAQVSNPYYRLLKSLTPGAYTFILPGTREVPKRLLHSKRKTIGIRVPQNIILMSVLEQLSEQAMMSCTLQLPNDETPMHDPEDIKERLGHQVDVIVDGGICANQSTTVLSLLDNTPELIRQGLGSVDGLLQRVTL